MNAAVLFRGEVGFGWLYDFNRAIWAKSDELTGFDKAQALCLND